MKATLLIARDSIRALLRQRLLVGLMLAALGLIVVFSIVLISERTMMTRAVIDQSMAKDDPGLTTLVKVQGEDPISGGSQVDPGAAGKSEAKRPDGPIRPKSPRTVAALSKEDRQKLAEQLDQVSSVFQTAFYEAASFGGSMVALFIFSSAVATEIRRGTIRITLTKPVSRTQYMLGKYLGGIVVMAGYAGIASAAIVLFAKFGSLELSPAMKFAPWLMFCRQLMLGSLAMLLSLFVHPLVGAVLAFFAGNGFYGRFNPLFYILPSYGAFNLFGQLMRGRRESLPLFDC